MKAFILNIPIVVKISRTCKNCQTIHNKLIIYKPAQDNFGQFIPSDSYRDIFDKAAIIIEGYSEDPEFNFMDMVDFCNYQIPAELCEYVNSFFEYFEHQNIIEVILQNASLHSQFTGKDNKDLDIPFDDLDIPNLKREIQIKRIEALEKGCCLDNKKLFVIDHIYSGVINKILP